MIRAFSIIATFAVAALTVGSPAAAGALDGCAANLPLGTPQLAVSAHTVEVCHNGYAALEDKDLRIPRWIAYVLLADHVFGCLPRKNDFHVDEELAQDKGAKPADYSASGYDKGHMAPAEDFAWDTKELHDSFSMANMAPQLPELNRQGWERLEEDVRAWAWKRGQVIVYVGPVVGGDEATIGVDRVAVPSAFWKVIIDPSRADAIAFIVPQAPVAKADMGSAFEVPILDVEASARVRLPLPASIDRSAVEPFWRADLTAFRKQHRDTCRAARPRS